MVGKYHNLRADPERRREIERNPYVDRSLARDAYIDRTGLDPVDDLGFAEAEYQGYLDSAAYQEVDAFAGSHESGFVALSTPDEVAQDALINRWLADGAGL